MNTATHVVFNYPMRDHASIPIADAFAWSDQQLAEHGLRWSPCRVVWADRSWSYAKGWWFTDDRGRLARVGAGAYGDLVVAERAAR